MKQRLGSTLLCVSALLDTCVFGAEHTIPNKVYDGPSHAEFTSVLGDLDGQKILPYPNETSYEWFYFDAVSTIPSSNESVVVVFYESTSDAFPGGIDSSPISASISGSFADGTTFSLSVPSVKNAGAVVQTTDDGSSGNWGTTGFSFAGTPQVAQYLVSIDNPSEHVKGTLFLESVAPAHYPCGADAARSAEAVCPHVGWSNAIPDSIAIASFIIGGQILEFQGVGYHDQNWGDIPFADAVKSWYWGHGRFGPYSLVWFDTLSTDGTEYVSGFVARDGEILGGGCAAGSVVVRPFGDNDTYPPTPSTGTPGGFTIEVPLYDGSKLVANATSGLVTVNSGYYDRFIGNIYGGVAGGPTFQGRAQWEQFNL